VSVVRLVPSKRLDLAVLQTEKSRLRIPAVLDEIGRVEVRSADVRGAVGNLRVGSM